MDAVKQLERLFRDYEKGQNPLFLLEALLLCLSEDMPFPEDLADWLTEGLDKYLAGNCAAMNGQEYRSLDECFQVRYGRFEKYRLFNADKERAGWANYLKYVFGLSNEKLMEVLESEGLNISGFSGRYARGLSKAKTINYVRQENPVSEAEKDALYKSLKPETRAIIDR